MKHPVEITERAWGEVQRTFAWLQDRSPRSAEKWKAGLLKAIDSLDWSPGRCSLAPESLLVGRDIRQLFYGRRKNIFRILFDIRGSKVCVLRVRHEAQDLLTDPEDL